MFMNQFAAFSEPYMIQPVPIVPTLGMTTLEFPCFTGVVGDLVGKHWSRIKRLKEDFQATFPGFDLTVKYDGSSFLCMCAAVADHIAFISDTFGTEIALANESIVTDQKYAGAVIGKNGKGLREIEAKLGNNCVIYHDSGAFYVKFPSDMSTMDRIIVMEDAKQCIYGRAHFLETRLSDAESLISDSMSVASFSTSCTTVSEESAQSQLSELFSGDSPTPFEASKLR